MDGTPQLLSNIQFSEAKKGYDRDQVDNFLRELSKKVAELQDMLREAAQRAEAAEAQVSEALKAKSVAESLAQKAQADAIKAREEAAAAPAQPANEIEAASGVLALAQKTAEAAVEEAETKAQALVADGRARAAMMVVEAEQEIVKIRERASKQVDTLVAEKLADVEVEVARLKVERDQLRLDVDHLSGYIEEHRNRLRDGVDELAKLLDEDAGALRIGQKPDLVAPDEPASAPAPAADADASADTAPAREESPAPEPTPEPAAPSDRLDDDDARADQLTTAGGTGADDTGGVTELTPMPGTSEPDAGDEPPEPRIVTVSDLAGEPPPARDPQDRPASSPAAPDVAPAPRITAVTVGDSGVGAGSPGNGSTGNGSTGPLPDRAGAASTGTDLPKAVIDLTGEHEQVATDEGEPTQAFDVIFGDAPPPATLHESEPPAPLTPSHIVEPRDSSLGTPDAGADEAMRAFFEADPDADSSKEAKGGRFLRRK